MSSMIFKNIFRFVLIVLIQVVLLNRINIGGNLNYFHFFLYPIFILFLPLRTHRIVIIFIAFLMGISLDFFYNSPGVHASTCLFTAFCRKYVLRFLEPVEGYNKDHDLSIYKMGIIWIASYTAILLLLHLMWYFSIEAFSYIFIKEIVFSTIFSFFCSYIVIVLFLLILNPKQ